MNQQPNQQGQQGQAQNRTLTFQPGQIQQLAKQCNYEFTEAKKLGLDTPAGQDHLKRAQRIKQVLVQYQQQQQQRQNSQQGQSPQVASQPQPQAQVQQPQAQSQQPQIQPQATQSPQIAQQSPQIAQNQAINQRNFNQQSPIPQQQGIPQQNSGLNSGATASPSPMAQNVGAPNTQNAGTPNPQSTQRNPFQQLQQIRLLLNEFQKNLKAIDEAKKNALLPQDTLNKLLQKEQVLKERYNSYKQVAINISQQVQQQQQQQQGQTQQQQQGQQQNFQQQSRSQSASQPQPDATASQIQSPSLMQNNIPGQQQTQQAPNANLQRSSSGAVPQIQGQPVSAQNNNNFQFQQHQSPQVAQQQIPQQQTQNINQLQNQQQRQPQPQQVQQQIQQQQAKQLPQQASTGLQQPAQQQNQTSQLPQTQQARSNLQSRTGTPQPQAGSVTGRSASPNTPVTNVNAAAKPNGTNRNIINPAQAANVFKSSVPSIAIPQAINVKPPTAVSINQNRPSLTGGNGISAPALTTPALMKLPPYEMQSDRVLSKRKLSELVKTVGADEGDGETTIDGDVEELLLDLADEFVTNVTSFACRLAKHRKSDNLDVKDIQLHLEKNWNIRIPGYSSDEIRSVRKWVPSAAHNQRIQGIGISKSVEQNK